MLINYTTTKLPTVGASSAIGGASAWSNPSRITADDGSSASWGAFAGAQMSAITGSSFAFDIPDFAVIDGISVLIDGSQTGCYGNVSLNIAGTTGKAIGTLATTYGGPTDLWGATEITLADINSISVTAEANDVSGGDGIAGMDYMSVTVYWHLSVDVAPSDVPTRVDYKAFARDGSYLGLIPNVSSELKFSQEKNSSGATLEIKSAQDLREVTEIGVLQTEDDLDILTESDIAILTESTDIKVTTGDNDDYAIYKNSNRIEAWLYNYWYPNGKRMFKGQVNKVTFSYGGTGDSVNLLVYSDGFDTSNYIARGLPASLTLDVSQASQNGTFTTEVYSFGGWEKYGQTWIAGAGNDNLGAITLLLQGTANVTVSVYDAPNGNLLGSATRSVSAGSATEYQFLFAPLITITPLSTYFFTTSVGSGQSILVYKHGTAGTYANGTAYNSSYSGGSGGGSWTPATGDLYFKTYEGTLTTTATFTSDDPVTEIASAVLADYNTRGGYITENDFDATGLSVSYTWIMATIYDVLNKVIELSPLGWYFYIDVGNALIDIKQQSVTPDFTIVGGKDIHQLDVALSIENVSNQLLFTGGPNPTTNLYRSYIDSESSAKYGLRTQTKTDNRVTLTATADAIGETFIEENSDEIQETRITVLNKTIDITLLTPGKTIGFVNLGSLIDSFVLQIVRRDYTPDAVVLTLGRLPVNLSTTVQSLNRGLLNEQTLNNPTTPS